MILRCSSEYKQILTNKRKHFNYVNLRMYNNIVNCFIIIFETKFEVSFFFDNLRMRLFINDKLLLKVVDFLNCKLNNFLRILNHFSVVIKVSFFNG